jgi:uncharacterized protein (TIGR02594 family)
VPKFISATHDKPTLTVQYVADNGDILLRSGGSIAWRFNNPGNVRPPSKFITTSIGVGNTKSGDFYIFPDYATGHAEKKALLRRKYNDDSIASAMNIYAPPSENDTEAYITWICTHTGFSRDRVLNTMSDSDLESMMSAMEKREGYYAYQNTRHEKWVKTTAVTLSNGAQPIPNQPVVVKSGDKQQTLKTNAFGQLPLLPYEAAGQQIQFLVAQADAQLKTIGTITTQAVSSAHVFFRDLFVTQAATAPHFPPQSPRTSPKKAFRYKIISGDTLGKIAMKFKTSVDQLKADNHLKSTRIFAGDFLYINGVKPVDADAPATHHSPAKPEAAAHPAPAVHPAPAAQTSQPSQAAQTGQTGQAGQTGQLSDLAKDMNAGKSGDTSPAATNPVVPATTNTSTASPLAVSPADSRATASSGVATAAAAPAATPVAASAAGATAKPNDAAKVALDRSKQGQGHPIAVIDAASPEAPWMAKALEQAKFWHGQTEDVITKTINYHKEVGGNLKSLVGNSNPWCASFVNWCLMQAGYAKTATPMDSQSFRWSKSFVKIDQPVFGAVAVYKHTKGGHAAFVYARTKDGRPILLGGNQSDAINFGTQNAKELKGFFVPAAYLKFAQDELKKGAKLETTTTDELNESFHIAFKKKKAHADR